MGAQEQETRPGLFKLPTGLMGVPIQWVEPRQPELDLQLGDGRILRHRGVIATAGWTGPDSPPSYSAMVWESEQKTPLRVMVNKQQDEQGLVYTHVSLSYFSHMPSWKDIRLVKDAFFGSDTDAMMVLPKEVNYINDHPFCHHLWSMPFDWTLKP